MHRPGAWRVQKPTAALGGDLYDKRERPGEVVRIQVECLRAVGSDSLPR
jgi:hypothetical protein